MSGSLFITFEGPEGTGKTTQCRILAEYLKEQGMNPVLTFEPGGTRIGSEIRNILLNKEYKGVTADMTELLLFSAARSQHLIEVILPSLESGRIVISDRYTDSTLAYQGYGRGINLQLIKLLNKISTGGLEPDFTILLDLEPEKGFERIHTSGKVEPDRDLSSEGRTFNGKDRIESEQLSFHKRVRDGFLEIARTHPRVFIVDASQSIDFISAEIQEIVRAFLQKNIPHDYEEVRCHLAGREVDLISSPERSL